MFQVLVESGAPRTTRGSWTAVSTIGHVALVAAAVAITAHQQDVGNADPIRDIVYYAPLVPAPARPAASSLPPGRTVVPVEIPAPTFTIPDMSAPGAPTLTDVFSRVAEDLRHAAAGIAGGDRVGSPGAGDVHTVANVDRIVAPLAGNPSPQYPRVLANAGIAGDVVVRFVVDTTGRVEPRSVVIVQTSHPAFGDAVRAWLKQTRYSPAQVSGRAVRQLVEQRVGFSLQR